MEFQSSIEVDDDFVCCCHLASQYTLKKKLRMIHGQWTIEQGHDIEEVHDDMLMNRKPEISHAVIGVIDGLVVDEQLVSSANDELAITEPGAVADRVWS